MWKNSFVATAVALGDNVDGALAAIGPAPGTDVLAAGLRAPQRPQRAHALATALRDVAIALDEVTLR